MSDTDRDYKAELQSAKNRHLLFMCIMFFLLLMSWYNKIVMYNDLQIIIERNNAIMDLYRLRLERVVEENNSCFDMPSTPGIQEPEKEPIEL